MSQSLCSRSIRRSRQGALFIAACLMVAAGCEPASDKTDIPSGTNSGRAGGAGGSGDSSPSGSGGASAGNGGPGGMAAGGSGGGNSMGSGGSGGAPSSPGNGIPLPMVVTTHYENQGWFGDSVVAAAFAPGAAVIKQEASDEGPCAARVDNARGKCLKITYTPPAGVTAPAVGDPYVGVFLLTTLLMPHPELMPPGMIGDANWGAEPGKVIAPGAAAINFSAAADSAGTAVTFKAGVMTDPFVIPEQTQTLGTSWQSYSLSLAGQSYEGGVIGAFAWVLKDTTQPATFYLDNIVWE